MQWHQRKMSLWGRFSLRPFRCISRMNITSVSGCRKRGTLYLTWNLSSWRASVWIITTVRMVVMCKRQAHNNSKTEKCTLAENKWQGYVHERDWLTCADILQCYHTLGRNFGGKTGGGWGHEDTKRGINSLVFVRICQLFDLIYLIV